MQPTRLSRNFEKKTRNRLILNILGTVIILVLLVKFGVPLLINFSLFLSGSKGSTPTTSNKGFIAPPLFNDTFTATNSASISLSGSSTPKATIKLFVNGELSNTTTVKEDGTFSFDNVALEKGDNNIKAKTSKDNSESDFSESLQITYSNKSPNLSIDSPSDGQSFSKDQNSVTVKGKTDPDIKVTVNNFWAVTDNSGNYSYNLQLQNGDNKIIVDAVDNAGNKTEKTITVKYSQ
jgi:hypothetical protein